MIKFTRINFIIRCQPYRQDGLLGKGSPIEVFKSTSSDIVGPDLTQIETDYKTTQDRYHKDGDQRKEDCAETSPPTIQVRAVPRTNHCPAQQLHTTGGPGVIQQHQDLQWQYPQDLQASGV